MQDSRTDVDFGVIELLTKMLSMHLLSLVLCFISGAKPNSMKKVITGQAFG